MKYVAYFMCGPLKWKYTQSACMLAFDLIRHFLLNPNFVVSKIWNLGDLFESSTGIPVIIINFHEAHSEMLLEFYWQCGQTAIAITSDILGNINSF